MHDDQERRMRELVYRLIEMAPEAPPFQEADMVELENHPAPARPTNRRTLVFVASLAAALVIGIAAPIIVFRNDPLSPPATQPTTTSTTIDPLAELAPLWPQTSLEEVRQAQELADAGDPLYTWQVDRVRGDQPAQNHPNDTGVFARFLEEVLGWEGFLWDEVFAHPDGAVPGDVVYIRCAPGLTNPLYPTDPVGGACAPTIDELRYETVKIHVAQFRESPGAIWVVTGWEMIEPFDQIAPPSDAEIALFLEPFFQARIDGEGAEEFAPVTADDPFVEERVDRGIPLLYASSTGAPYERSEFELIDGPVWPSGEMMLELRLFADNDETVVEQVFSLDRDETGRLRLVYDFQPMGPEGLLPATIENGEAVLVEYSVLDGQVSYRAAYPFKPADYQLEASQDANDAWNRGPDRTAIVGHPFVDRRAIPLLLLLVDPVPIGSGCQEAPAPGDAADLALSIQSDPDFEATPPVAVTIGGIPALQIDLLVKQHASWCWTDSANGLSHHVLFNETPVSDDQLVRLYLLDLPGGSARVLAIVIFNADLDQALELAAPIVDSIEFHTR